MKIFYRASAVTVRILARLIFRIRIFNKENVPSSGALILASNHISYLDPPLAGSFVGREIHFMAKKELFRNRLFGKLISYHNAHPINRKGFDKAAIDLADKLLRSQQGLIIFPEGTRAKGGEFLPPRPGIGLIALSTMTPVLPLYIHGANNLANCFWGKDRLGIIFGRPIGGDEMAGYSRDKEGYRRFAEYIMERIRGLKDEFLRRAGLK
jgi:1-acyl-sn-glycerol-3-phosphate acyltransferase